MKKNENIMRNLYYISFAVITLLVAGCAKETAPEEAMNNKVQVLFQSGRKEKG